MSYFNEAARRSAIEAEVLVTRQVIALASHGCRPMLIGELLGKRISASEIRRIVKLASSRDNSRGRLPDARKVMGLPRTDRTALARLLRDYMTTLARGFERMDALLAAWRIYEQVQAVNPTVAVNPLQTHDTRVDIELFVVAIRLNDANRLFLRHCSSQDCRAPNIFHDGRDTLCSTCREPLSPFDCDSVTGQERRLYTPLCNSRSRLRPAPLLKVA